MNTPGTSEREFARIQVRLRARFLVVEAEEAVGLRDEILSRPAVWAPSCEAALRELASSASSGAQGLIAQALLESVAQIVRLHARVLDRGGPMQACTIGELSGNGGQLTTELILGKDARLDLRLSDEVSGAPPIRALAEVVHHEGPPSGRYGFRFGAIHPADRDRLIRFLYQVQREALRNAHGVFEKVR